MSIAQLGMIAPYFKAKAVLDDGFKELSLADYKGKYLVLVFHPLNL